MAGFSGGLCRTLLLSIGPMKRSGGGNGMLPIPGGGPRGKRLLFGRTMNAPGGGGIP